MTCCVISSIPGCGLDVERYIWKPKVAEGAAVLVEADDASSFEGSGSEAGSGSETGDHEGDQDEGERLSPG